MTAPVLPRKPWLWASEAAALLNVSARTVRRYCEAEALICRRLPSGYWQVSRESIEKIDGQVGQVGQP